jgi:RsmE family RNA methyltransferase
MNLLLLEPGDFIDATTACVAGRRYRHLLEVLKTAPGQRLRVGLLDGGLGYAEILRQDERQALLQVALTEPPPPPPHITLLLALPRPKVVRRLLQGLTSFGIKRIILFNSARVDKSYWQTPFLGTEAIREQLLLGLEQARDTILPEVLLRPRFRPFVEDELPALVQGSLPLVAHPGTPHPCPSAAETPVTLAIGPEGGFVPFEIDLLVAHEFQPVHLGVRALRVETAVSALLGRLLPS